MLDVLIKSFKIGKIFILIIIQGGPKVSVQTLRAVADGILYLLLRGFRRQN